MLRRHITWRRSSCQRGSQSPAPPAWQSGGPTLRRHQRWRRNGGYNPRPSPSLYLLHHFESTPARARLPATRRRRCPTLEQPLPTSTVAALHLPSIAPSCSFPPAVRPPCSRPRRPLAATRAARHRPHMPEWLAAKPSSVLLHLLGPNPCRIAR